jgi:hypothetical protein
VSRIQATSPPPSTTRCAAPTTPRPPWPSTHTAHGVDLADVAGACGFAATSTVTRADEVPTLRAAVREAAGPILAVVKVAAESLPLVLPPREGRVLKARFREAVGG